MSDTANHLVCHMMFDKNNLENLLKICVEYSIFWGWACTTHSSQHLCNYHVTWKWKLFSWKILLFLYCFLTVYQKYFSYVRSFLIIIFESLFQLCLVFDTSKISLIYSLTEEERCRRRSRRGRRGSGRTKFTYFLH